MAGGLLEAWRPGLGVWNVVGGGLVRVCLGLVAGQVRVTVLVSWGLDLGALCGGGAGGSAGGMEVGTGGVERCRGRPGPCLSGSGGWPSTGHGPGLLGPGPGGPV